VTFGEVGRVAEKLTDGPRRFGVLFPLIVRRLRDGIDDVLVHRAEVWAAVHVKVFVDKNAIFWADTLHTFFV
jgi:hypothetical protein